MEDDRNRRGLGAVKLRACSFRQSRVQSRKRKRVGRQKTRRGSRGRDDIPRGATPAPFYASPSVIADEMGWTLTQAQTDRTPPKTERDRGRARSKSRAA